MRVIRIREARRRLSEMGLWSDEKPRRNPEVRRKIIRCLADYQRRRLLRIAEAFDPRNRPA